jgi:hypothetical protein
MTEVLKQATEYAQKHYPNESLQRQTAFVNSVVYLVTGWSASRYGGPLPSIREVLVSWWVNNSSSIKFDHWSIGHDHEIPLPKPGEWTLDEAILVCDAFAFRSLPKAASLRVAATEDCFNDDPEDLERIKDWEESELKKLSDRQKAGKLNPQEHNHLRYLKERLGGPNG